MTFFAQRASSPKSPKIQSLSSRKLSSKPSARPTKTV